MTIDPVVFFDFVIALFVLSVALASLAISYSQIIKKFNSQKDELESLTSRIYEKEAGVLKDARNKAESIINEAVQKAQEIIAGSNIVNTQSKKALDEAFETLLKHQTGYFEKASQDFLQVYKNELEALKQKNIEILKNTSKSIEEDTVKEVQDFDNVLEQETVASQKIIQEKIEKDYSKVQKEVEQYKNEMLGKVDAQISKLIQDVSKKVIGKSLSLQEHEQLIIDALEEAKKNGLTASQT
ncbi:MAG: hypothetical protein HYT08_04215 [Candidatus Levybacteria bacterium]|nr:hypothetical protein [Candidatus Levybacteria bacterium]